MAAPLVLPPLGTVYGDLRRGRAPAVEPPHTVEPVGIEASGDVGRHERGHLGHGAWPVDVVENHRLDPTLVPIATTAGIGHALPLQSLATPWVVLPSTATMRKIRRTTAIFSSSTS